MNCRLLLLRLYLPAFLKRSQLLELHRRTAAALGYNPDHYVGAANVGSYQDMLHRFAAFTSNQAQLTLITGISLEELPRRLHREAEAMGRGLREKLRLHTDTEFQTALGLAYRALGIDLHVSASGEVIIRRCFFSRYYSAAVCRLISALDDGLVEGLSGGCRLRFTDRLTEGSPYCRAMIERPGEPKEIIRHRRGAGGAEDEHYH